MRLPYAAKQLVEQVLAEQPRATAKPHSDPDGLGVVRTIQFDKRTSKWLAPLMEQMDDRRIAGLSRAGGYLRVTFVATPLADQRDRFPLEAAAEVLSSESELRPEVDDGEQQESEQDQEGRDS